VVSGSAAVTEHLDRDAARFVAGIIGALLVEAFVACVVAWVITGASGFAWGAAASAGATAAFGVLRWGRSRQARR
jgi:CO dehydrogenase/acetyl-CoA synthase alpha subunit